MDAQLHLVTFCENQNFWQTCSMLNCAQLCQTCLIVLSNFTSEWRESSIILWVSSKNLMWIIMTLSLSTNAKQIFCTSADCCAKMLAQKYLIGAQKLRWWEGCKFSFTSNATTVRNVRRKSSSITFQILGFLELIEIFQNPKTELFWT